MIKICLLVVVQVVVLISTVRSDDTDNITMVTSETMTATVINMGAFFKLAGIDTDKLLHAAENNTELQDKLLPSLTPLNKTFVQEALSRNDTDLILQKVRDIILASPLLQTYLLPGKDSDHGKESSTISGDQGNGSSTIFIISNILLQTCMCVTGWLIWI
ncbi:hypothetical protein SNE40_005041 [Patella caerulea]|uniref:Uncharacterized protein n=1 Tax=Patella caerulea TaxID=87958 RepID=A0AAN8K479_PATCE